MKFTPESEFMSLPGDIARTQFRLVATHEGWEYVVLEREMGADRDPSRSMLVTVRLPTISCWHALMARRWGDIITDNNCRQAV